MRIEGTIQRRLLVNFRAPLGDLAARIPAPFRPKPVPGSRDEGMAGICLIHLAGMRPAGWPAWTGTSSQNATHRIAVEWDAADGTVRDGVYIPMRHTASPVARFGGRLMNTLHESAQFQVHDQKGRLAIDYTASDGQVHVVAHEASALRSGAFRSLPEASEFFAGGSTGYSPRRHGFLGVTLETRRWDVRPMRVEAAHSTFLEDVAGPNTTFDCALVMRDIPHSWRTEGGPC